MVLTLLILGVSLAATPGLEELEHAPDNPVELNRANQEKAQFYLDGMWSTLDSLHFGEVSVTEIESIGGKRNEYQYKLKFSYPEDLVRYDLVRSPTGRSASFIRTSEEQLLELPSKGGGPTTVSKFPLGEVLTYDGTNPVDLRTLGVTTVAAHRGSRSLEWLKERLTIDGHKTTGTLSEIDESSGAHIDLIWVGESSSGQKFKTLLRLDSSRGYTPILRVHIRSDGAKYSVASLTQTDWEQKDGIWVPVHVLMEGVSPDAKHEFRLSWKSVNLAMPPDTFTLAGLSPPGGTQIINHKIAGESFVEGVVGEAAANPTMNGTSSWFRTILVFANVAVFCVLIAWFLIYQARRQQN